MLGQVWLLNVWASWCVACKQEHALLVNLAKQNIVPIVGLDYKDNVKDAENWLRNFGNPYAIIAVDADGKTGIDYGVYGVPETYVIDQQGTIIYKQTGIITQAVLDEKLLPLIKGLQAQ